MSYNQDNSEQGYKRPWDGERKQFNNGDGERKPYNGGGGQKTWDGQKKPWSGKPKVDNIKVDLIGKQLTKFFDVFVRTMKRNNLVIDEALVTEFQEGMTGKVKGFCVALPNINDDGLLERVNRHVENAMQKGYTFRHINVSYVEKKLDASLDRKKAYIPWAGYNDSKAEPITDKKPAETYFAERQSGWEEWKPFLKAIYIASYAMLMGENGEGKVAFVLTLNADRANNAPETRDMARVLKLARELDIPIYDINDSFEIPS